MGARLRPWPPSRGVGWIGLEPLILFWMTLAGKAGVPLGWGREEGLVSAPEGWPFKGPFWTQKWLCIVSCRSPPRTVPTSGPWPLRRASCIPRSEWGASIHLHQAPFCFLPAVLCPWQSVRGVPTPVLPVPWVPSPPSSSRFPTCSVPTSPSAHGSPALGRVGPKAGDRHLYLGRLLALGPAGR